MSSIREPIHQIEPANLLEPTNLLEPLNLEDLENDSQVSTVPREGGQIPPHERPNGTSAGLQNPAVPVDHGRSSYKLALLAIGAIACIGTGAALPGLTAKLAGIGATTMSQAPRPAPNARASSAQPDRSSQATAEASTELAPSTNAPPNPGATDQATARSNDPVPCDQQTWPTYEPQCLKGVPANPSAPVRTVVPAQSSDGAPVGSADAPSSGAPPLPAPASSQVLSSQPEQQPHPDNGSESGPKSSSASNSPNSSKISQRHTRHPRVSDTGHAVQQTPDQQASGDDSDPATSRADRRDHDTDRRASQRRHRDDQDTRGNDDETDGRASVRPEPSHDQPRFFPFSLFGGD
jgi:hypothetical protein